jgi:NTP pyrophosphatase (non-canonical NTP hydrolase)
MRYMNCQLYENQALQFFERGHRHHEALLDGLYEEATEVLDAKTKLDRADELGDLLWYITVIAHTEGFSLSEIMMRNINKLEIRKLTGKNT